MVKQCWCGNSALIEFSPDYLKCADCQTLMTRRDIQPIHDKVMDDEKGFYGKEYWFGFQEKILGYPNIEKRARTDLPERCLHWLETLIKYRLPPAKVLEIGSAHGGFVALMRETGYDSTGLELSPSIAKLAEQTFRIPTLCGPVEDQSLAAGSLDAIVMMDVFEHLPRPAKTIRHCLKLLKPEGFFFIQTPRLPEGITHEELLRGKSAFLEQLKPDEHLYLFSMESVKKFLQSLDLAFVSFEAPAFPKYDMALVAARTQLHPTKEEDRDACLQKTTSSRMIQAMLDMRGQLQLSGAVMKRQAEEITYLRKRNPNRIAVDLTPILPGGTNGGTKIVAQELIKNLGLLAPECEFVLLTSNQNHDELSVLDSPNIRRLCVLHGAGSGSPARPQVRKGPLLSKLRDRLSAFVPDTVMASLIGFYRRRSLPTEYISLIQRINPDLLFCPFTAPFYYHPTVPTVSVIHEILFLRYPQFFQPETLNARHQHFRNACRLADRLVCVSEDLRQDVLKHVQLSPDRLVTIPNCMSRRFGDPARVNGLDRLKAWMLEDNGYLLYPANFWPHKNHKMLFTAFGMYVKKHPGAGLKLACPGAPLPGLEPLKEAVKRMGLEDRIIFPGYANEHDMAILFKHCRAVIYPTLYEGFGMPVLEAAVFGKPVLASKTPTTREIAGSSVYYFDARKPADIAEAIEIAHNSPEDLPILSPAASAVNRFSDTRQMAAEYLVIFKDAVNRHRPDVSFRKTEGIHPDGWVSERAVIFHDAVKTAWLEIAACLPDFFPYPVSYLQIRQCKTNRLSVHLIRREKSSIIRWNLPESAGSVELAPQPLYQPKAHGFNDDERWLGCLIKHIELVTPSKREKIYEGPFA